MLTIESNIPEQILTIDAGGAKSVELVITQYDQQLEIGNYPVANITYTGVSDVQNNLQTHIDDTNNPHQVKANQITDTIDFTLLFDNALI